MTKRGGWLSKIWTGVGVDRYDVMALAGLAMLCWGLYQIMPAVAWMAGGIALLAMGVAGAARKGASR